VTGSTPKGPFHAGEVALQTATGMREKMAAAGSKAVRDYMPDQHRELFEKLPLLFVGALDDDGQPWATVLHGPPGFVLTPDSRTLRVSKYPAPDDPARTALRVGAPVGLLGIELHTRRRNRANGSIAAAEDDAWSVRVYQSFGNCPKYIHAREPRAYPERAPQPAVREERRLSDDARALIASSDTLFIATASAERLAPNELVTEGGAGVDVSHRGGRVGFVEIVRGEKGDELRIPDYAGNSMFNTLGNLLVWPRAGLLFLDFTEGHVLELAATASLRSDDAELERFPGALRLLTLAVHGGWLRRAAVPIAWTAPEPPPQFRTPGRDGQRP
jgi:predicted pyridoxine 5'-phosphate oxidase superfamily flavin-nucleotide-binding protein